MKKILIFSADSDFCKSLTLLFQLRYQVISSNVLEELDVLIDNENIDLLLADSNKSDQKVYLFINNLRNIYKNLLIVLLDVHKQNSHTNVDETLIKPVDANQMLNVIDDLFVSVSK